MQCNIYQIGKNRKAAPLAVVLPNPNQVAFRSNQKDRAVLDILTPPIFPGPQGFSGAISAYRPPSALRELIGLLGKLQPILATHNQKG